MSETSIRNRRILSTNKRLGSTLVEFALVLPLLLLITFGLIQYGIYANTAVTLTNLSREGARYAATQPNSDAGIKDRMEDVCPPSIRWVDIKDNITITTINNQPRVRPYLIQVQITFDMKNKAFMPTSFTIGTRRIAMGTPPVYTARAVMMIE